MGCLELVFMCPSCPTVFLVQQHHLVALCFVFQICLKGKVHIFKYLNIQACRLDKKPDTLDLPSLGKRCLPQPLTDRYHDLLFCSLTLDALSAPTPAYLYPCSCIRGVYFFTFPAWKIFIPIRTMDQTLESAVTMVIRGCLQLRSELKHTKIPCLPCQVTRMTRQTGDWYQ